MVEHSAADREVPGSNPGAPSAFFFYSFFPISHEDFFSNSNGIKTTSFVLEGDLCCNNHIAN